MSDLELIKILGSFGGGVGVLYLLAKAGLLRLSIGGNGGNGHNTYSQTQMDKATEDAVWRGETTQTLKHIKTHVEEFGERLSRHLENEENDVKQIWEAISKIEKKIG